MTENHSILDTAKIYVEKTFANNEKWQNFKDVEINKTFKKKRQNYNLITHETKKDVQSSMRPKIMNFGNIGIQTIKISLCCHRY